MEKSCSTSLRCCLFADGLTAGEPGEPPGAFPGGGAGRTVGFGHRVSPAVPCSSSAHVLTSTGPRAGGLGQVETCPVARAAGTPWQQERSGRGPPLPAAPLLLREGAVLTLAERSTKSRGSEPGAGSCGTEGGLDALALPWGDCSGSPARAKFRRGAGDGAQDPKYRQRTRGTAGNRLDSRAVSPEGMPRRPLSTHTTPATSARTTGRRRVRLTPGWTLEGLLPALSPGRGLGDEASPLGRPRSGGQTRGSPPGALSASAVTGSIVFPVLARVRCGGSRAPTPSLIRSRNVSAVAKRKALYLVLDTRKRSDANSDPAREPVLTPGKRQGRWSQACPGASASSWGDGALKGRPAAAAAPLGGETAHLRLEEAAVTLSFSLFLSLPPPPSMFRPESLLGPKKTRVPGSVSSSVANW